MTSYFVKIFFLLQRDDIATKCGRDIIAVQDNVIMIIIFIQRGPGLPMLLMCASGHNIVMENWLIKLVSVKMIKAR